MSRNYYAFTVMVAGKKRHGGCLHADSMDDAAQKAAKLCKLTLRVPDNPHMDPSLRLDGKRASLAVWAIPETLNGVLPRESVAKDEAAQSGL